MVFLTSSHVLLSFVSDITFKPESSKSLSLRYSIAFIIATYKPNHSERGEDWQGVEIYKFPERVRVMIVISVLNIFKPGD